MEQKNNVKFTNTSFYAENLGDGNFVAVNIYRWECRLCGKTKNFSTMPPAKGCSASPLKMHSWRRVS